jgi:hypothetical protein
VKQWGEWLRASPRKPQRAAPATHPLVSSGSFNNRLVDSKTRYGNGVSIHDIPPRRKLNFPQAESSLSRTGGGDLRRERGDVTSPAKDRRVKAQEEGGGKSPVVETLGKNKVGTFTRRPWQQGRDRSTKQHQLPLGMTNKKRIKQVWLPVIVCIVGKSFEFVEKQQ